LEKRKQQILKAVVDEFTVSAVPVASQALVSRHFVNLSSATIRNELSDLVDLGYLVQPHTSAGRVPTDRGYRYFVDFLMEVAPLPVEVEAYIECELRLAPADPQSLVERVATTIANVTHNAAVVTAASGAQVRVKHLDLVSLEPREVLVILLVEGNQLRQRVVSLTRPTDQSELTMLANKFNHELGGTDLDGVRTGVPALAESLEKELLSGLADVLESFERGTATMVVHDGVRNLLMQPEFAEPARLHQVLEVLEETRYLAALLQELARSSDLQVVIGSENQTSQLHSCAVILTTYGPSRRVKGVLGVVGPTRIDYAATVGRLRTVARHASERMAAAIN
jgi:heat-inducible transcriptional repressor